MHKIMINCQCKRQIERTIDYTKVNRNFIDCVCGASYYVKFNGESYEIDLISEDK